MLTDVKTASKIGISNTILSIHCVYRSPSSTCDQDVKLLKTLQGFTSNNGESLILDDFNAPAIYRHTRSCSAKGAFLDHPLEFGETWQLFQGITFPTRFGTGTSPLDLDLAFFNAPDAFSQVSRLSPIVPSDHAFVKPLLKWRTSRSNEPFRPRRWTCYKRNTA